MKKEPIGLDAEPESLVLTLDSWSPSFDRGHEEEPTRFESSCECWQCLAMSDEERQSAARNDWMRGGRVRCRLLIFESPRSWGGPWNEPRYQARVSFYGADDCSMKKLFLYEEDARRFVCHLPVFVTQDWLLSHGFLFQ